VSRLPIRLRLTAAFAVAMVVVLAGAGLFVYLRLKDDLDESVTAALSNRAAAALAAGASTAGAAGESEEGFAQLRDMDGGVLDSAGGIRGEPLGPDELRRAVAGAPILVERTVPGIEGTTRVLAQTGGARLVVVGQSLQDRDDALDNLATSFGVGGPVAVLLASLLGYALAAAGLRPVEAMRRRAQNVSLSHGDERLPLPAAHDEIRRLGGWCFSGGGSVRPV
jgi:two-component system, OmpR family, sensor kinase